MRPIQLSGREACEGVECVLAGQRPWIHYPPRVGEPEVTVLGGWGSIATAN